MIKEYTIKINGITKSIKEIVGLNKVLDDLDKKVKKVDTTPVKGVSRAKALSEEEKAAKKLADTQQRLNKINDEANRKQIELNQQLREKQREVTREIVLNQLAEGSIAAMGMQLTRLRNAYEKLSEAERENEEIGGKMIVQIQELDKKYKNLRESTGNFRDSVGNYEKALSGLDKLDKGLSSVGNEVSNLSAKFASSTALMTIFGDVTSTTEKAQKELAKIIALVTLAQKLSNAATSQGIITTTAKNVVDKISITQIKAKAAAEALATKGTIAARIAQAAFNAVAYANPYVLLAMALVGVVGSLALFTSHTEDATKAQKKLNEEQNIWLDYLDNEDRLAKQVSEERVKALERQLKLLKAQGGKVQELRKIENDIYKEKVRFNDHLKKQHYEEFANLEKNRQKLGEYNEMLHRLRRAQNQGLNQIKLDVDLNGNAKKVKVEEALDIVQNKVNTLNRKVEFAIKIKTEGNDLAAQLGIDEAARRKEEEEEAKREKEKAKRCAEEYKRKIEEARNHAKERTALELEAQRALEDLRLKLQGKSVEAQRKLIEVDYKRQKEDLQTRLKNEANLTLEARKSINAQIVLLEEAKTQALNALQDKILEKEKETARELQDQEASLLQGYFERKMQEINLLYDRQIEGVKERLEKEKDLTEKQTADLNAILENFEKQREKEKSELILEGLNRRAALELQIADRTLKEVQNKINNAVKRNQEGLFKGVIDPEATREALEEVDASLSRYVKELEEYQAKLKEAHDATLRYLKAGTAEYDEEMQKYASAMAEVTDKIFGAQKMQQDNTKKTSQLMGDYYKEVFSKIGEWADRALQVIGPVMETLNMGLQASIDSLKEQMEEVNKGYEAAQEQREKAVSAVEETERRLQNATGATSLILKEQLEEQVRARDNALQEERRQAQEKERLEALAARKEKQKKRNELVVNIAMGIANSARAVLSVLPNFVLAGIVGAMGAVQVGIMAQQLTKLEKGGPIKGPSHAKGGVNINVGGKPSYEAQGGEFMINDKSYARNKALTEFLNASPHTLTAVDLRGVVPGFDNVPVSVNDLPRNNNDRIIEAIKEVNFNPVVSVKDIIEVTDEVTSVREITGV